MAYSYPTIIEIFKYCPVPLSVTSTKRNGNFDYHDFGQAVDFAAIYGTMPRLQADSMMRDAAKWWYQFSGRLLELIHTTPFSTDNGFYVKHGSRVGPGFYGWATESAHLDHVHVAISPVNANYLLTSLRNRYGSPGRKAIYRSNGTFYFPSSTTAPTAKYHTVRAGDTLSGIAVKYAISMARLIRLNGIKDPNKIIVGQRLRVG